MQGKRRDCEVRQTLDRVADKWSWLAIALWTKDLIERGDDILDDEDYRILLAPEGRPACAGNCTLTQLADRRAGARASPPRRAAAGFLRSQLEDVFTNRCRDEWWAIDHRNMAHPWQDAVPHVPG